MSAERLSWLWLCVLCVLYLYVLKTFALGVDALDPLNPTHHQHIGVGLLILFFEVMYENFIDSVMNFMT